MDNSFEKLINRVLDGRYKIENVVGIGGMAYVLKAKDMQENRTVAIKILNEESNGDERAVKRFINESEAIKMISASNIVKIYDIAISETLKYIVMEYIDGITLKDYIDKVGALGWKESVHYVKQILAGLSSAHEKNVVHRDIKPQNIMLLKDGHVKVTDFGIAKTPTSEPITMTDKAIGTVNYISPEQASGTKVNFKTDLYSVGVMLYELVTGELPFKAESPVAVAMMQVSSNPVPPREINPSIPVGLEQIILKAMSKDPEERFSSAGAMMKALDYFAKNPTVVFAQSSSAAAASKKAVASVNGNNKKNNQRSESESSSSMFPIILGIVLSFLLVFSVFIVCLFFGGRSNGENEENKNNFSVIDEAIGYGKDKGNDEIRVKDYINKQYTMELKQELEDIGFVVVVKSIKNDSFPNGAIVNQNPEAGKSIKRPKGNREMVLHVNGYSDSTTFVMDDYSNYPYEDVVDDLMNKFSAVLPEYDKSNIEIKEVFNSKIAEGMVVRTSPMANDTFVISPNKKIFLYVSLGPSDEDKMEMPNVIGVTEHEARRLIEESGLSLGDAHNEPNDEVEAGLVIRASYQEGDLLEEGEEIELWISTGPEKKDDQQPDNTDPPENDTQNGNGEDDRPVQDPVDNTDNNTDTGNQPDNSQNPTTDPDTDTPAPPETNDTQQPEQGTEQDSSGLDALVGMRGEQ